MQGNYRDVIKLATPILLGGLAHNSIAFTDTAFLSRYGQAELSAVGIVSTWYLLLFMVGFAFTKGTQIFTARRLGEKNLPAIGSIFTNSFVILLALGFLVFLALRFGASYAMDWYFDDKVAAAAGTAYLEMRSFGIFFSFTGSVFLAFYMGIGTLSVLVWAMVIMSTVNILLNWILIFGHWGFPEMGITGSALASNIAELMVAVIFVVYTLAKKLHVKYSFFAKNVLSLDIAKSITSISVPIVALTLVGLLGWIFFMYFVEKMGAFDTQISNLVKSLYMLLGMPAWAFAAASGTIISNLMGQGLYHRVFEAMKNIAVLSFACTLLVSLPLLFFPEFIVEYALDPELPALIPACTPVLYVTIGALLIYSVSTVVFHGIVSTGSVGVSLIIEIFTIALYVGFVVLMFAYDDKTVALMWTSEIFYWLLLLVVAFLYFRSGRWKNTQI